MNKNKFLYIFIGLVLFGICFIGYALTHPEASLNISLEAAYTIYILYIVYTIVMFIFYKKNFNFTYETLVLLSSFVSLVFIMMSIFENDGNNIYIIIALGLTAITNFSSIYRRRKK